MKVLINCRICKETNHDHQKDRNNNPCYFSKLQQFEHLNIFTE